MKIERWLPALTLHSLTMANESDLLGERPRFLHGAIPPRCLVGRWSERQGEDCTGEFSRCTRRYT